tara:strand:+ start:66 stop:812 length:747 start_codon:yes stop_codon:yes gene_type:complete
MAQKPRTAADLRRFCDGQHSAAQAHIDRTLNDLAVDVGFNRAEVLRAITEYANALSSDLTEDEFYDAVAFLADQDITSGFDANIIEISIFGDNVLQNWTERTNAPPVEMREPLLRALFANYLKSITEGGANYVSHHVHMDRWQPNELAKGELPAGVSLHLDGRWVINGVKLPKGVVWHHPVACFEWSGLPVDVRRLIESKRIYSLLAPKKGHPDWSILKFLQQNNGIGSAKANQILTWLKKAGCEVLE